MILKECTARSLGKYKRFVDLNRILQIANIVIWVANLAIYFTEVGSNRFIDGAGVVWVTMIAAQVQLMLAVDRKYPNPLVKVLMISTIFFYLLRVMTLQLMPESGLAALVRFEMQDAQNMNDALMMLFLGVWAIYVGVMLPTYWKGENAHCDEKPVTNTIRPASVIVLFVMVIVVSVYFVLNKDFYSISSGGDRLMAVINAIMDPAVVVIIAASYLITSSSILTPRVKAIMVILFGLFLFARVLQGSRSGMLILLYSLLFVADPNAPSYWNTKDFGVKNQRA